MITHTTHPSQQKCTKNNKVCFKKKAKRDENGTQFDVISFKGHTSLTLHAQSMSENALIRDKW